jgi:hypothetical protein
VQKEVSSSVVLQDLESILKFLGMWHSMSAILYALNTAFYGLRSYFMCSCKLGILNLDNITTVKGKPGETGTFAASFFQLLLLLHDRSGKDSTRLHSCN